MLPALDEPVDVYSKWLDAIEEENTRPPQEAEEEEERRRKRQRIPTA